MAPKRPGGKKSKGARHDPLGGASAAGGGSSSGSSGAAAAAGAAATATATGTGTRPASVVERAAVMDALGDANNAKSRGEACVALAGMFEPRARDDARRDAAVRKDARRLLKDGLARELVERIVDQDVGVRLYATAAVKNLLLSGGEPAVVGFLAADAFTALEKSLVETMGVVGVARTTSAAAPPAAMASAAERKQNVALHTALGCLDAMEVLAQLAPTVAEKRVPASVKTGSSPIAQALGGGSWAAAGDAEAATLVAARACALLHAAMDDNAELASALFEGDGVALDAVERAAGVGPTAPLASVHAAGALLEGAMALRGAAGNAAAVKALTALQRAVEPLLLSTTGLPDASAEVVAAANAVDEDAVEEEAPVLHAWLDDVQARALALDVCASALRGADASAGDARAEQLVSWVVRVAHNAALVLATAPWALEVDVTAAAESPKAPTALLLPVAALQKRAAEFAQAMVERKAPGVDAGDVARRAAAAVATHARADVFEFDALRDRLAATVGLMLSAVTASGEGASLSVAAEALRGVYEDGARASASVEVRALVVGALGALGELECAPTELRRGVAVVLSRVLEKDPSVVVVCEAADAVIDMFCADEAGAEYRATEGLEGNMASLAQTLAHRITALKLQDAMAFEEHAERMDAVRENVEAFVPWRRRV